jgi:predicted nicotinamide N-methyase
MTDDTDCPLFSPEMFGPTVFGAFSADAELELSGVAPAALRVVQNVEQGGAPSVLLWNSAVALSRAWWSGQGCLPCARDRRILELGAGLGVCSLTAAALGGEVVATEIEPALTALRSSIARNGHSRGHANVVTHEWCWGSAPSFSTAFDVVLGTDLLYSPALHAPLLEALRHVCTPGHTTILLAYEERAGEHGFFDAAERELGVVGEVHALDEPVRLFVGRQERPRSDESSVLKTAGG